MLEKGQDIELHIDRLGLDGMAVGRHDGLVCFVRNAVPGETVRATVARTRRKHVEAEAVEILAPCDKRVQPRCRHFGTCGGCVWQHVAYDMQLREKQQFVVDAFERIGGFSGIQVLPIIGSGDEYFYRNKMEFSFSRQRWLTTEELRTGGEIEKRFGLGLHVPRRYDKVLDIEECLLQSELSNAILNAVREVVGIDSVESAIDDARRNAQINNVGNCRFFLGDLKERLTKDTAWLTGHPDVIVVDPPRSGLHPKVVEQIAKLNPDRIVYVSCNPATQARDARMFTTAGYELSRLQPVDMFPHTSHVENVASFQKVQKST